MAGDKVQINTYAWYNTIAQQPQNVIFSDRADIMADYRKDLQDQNTTVATGHRKAVRVTRNSVTTDPHQR